MEEYEYEEERAVVMVDLHGVFDSDVLLKGQQSMKIIGVDTEEPFLQIGNYIFSGEYEDTSGTVVFFEKPEEAGIKGQSQCICKTDKKLTMKRVFLEKKCQETESPHIAEEVLLDVITKVVEENNSIIRMGEDASSPVPNKVSAEIECVIDEAPKIEVPHVSPKNTAQNIPSEIIPQVEDQIESMDVDMKIVSVDKVEAPSDSVEVSVNSTSPEVLKLDGVRENSILVDENESEDLSDAEGSTKSSDFDDLVIVSEIDESNEASCDRCDSSLSVTVAEAEDSTEGTSEAAHVSKKNVRNVTSGIICDSPTTTCSTSNSIAGIISSLVSTVHLNLSNTVCLGSDSTVGQTGIVDSASHLIRGHSSRLSDSSLPLICDSASNGNFLRIDTQSRGNGNLDSTDPQLDVAENGYQQITTSEVAHSGSRNVDFRSEDVSECEAMEIDADNTVNTTDPLPSRDRRETRRGNEPMESSGTGVTESTAKRSNTKRGRGGRSRINSTSNEVIQTSQQDSRSNLPSTLGNEAGTSTSFVCTVKDSVDSTSNQVFPFVQKVSNFKASGIDSTTNDTGDRTLSATVNSSRNAAVASSTEIPNGSIDSTINNVKVTVEEVDFEMREATQSVEEVDLTVSKPFAEVNQSIDSTSSSSVKQSSHNSADSNKENTNACEVSASCSGTQHGTKFSNIFQSSSNSPQSENTSSTEPDENVPSCKVTESHLDESRLLYPGHSRSPAILGSGRSEGSVGGSSNLVSGSCRFSGDRLSQPRAHSSPCVRASLPQYGFESHSPRPFITITKEELQKILILSRQNKSLESFPSSSRSTTETERRVLEHVAELSRQIRVCAPEFATTTNRYSQSGMGVDHMLLNHGVRAHMQHSSQTCTSSNIGYIDPFMEIESGPLNLVARKSDQNRGKSGLHSFTRDEQITESNMDTEDVIVDVVADFSVGVSDLDENASHQADTCGVDQQNKSEENNTVRGSEEVECCATSSSYVRQSQINDVSESQMDVEHNSSRKVSESLELRAAGNTDSCESSSDHNMECEVTESDEGLVYFVAEASESEVEAEVTESCSSNRSSAFEVTESQTDQKRNLPYRELHTNGAVELNEPCGSSNELSASTALAESDGALCIVTEPYDEIEGNDSRPSSSKEITESNISVEEEVVYIVPDSPEAETAGNLCSSSSNNNCMQSTSSARGGRMSPVTQHTTELSELCSSSGNHPDVVRADSDVSYLAGDHLEQNEAEVAESCSDCHIYPPCKVTQPDTANAVTESVSSRRRCDSISETEDMRNRSTESLEGNRMEVTESCASSEHPACCEVTESHVDASQQNSCTESSEELDTYGSSRGELDSRSDAVSDSTNVFNVVSEKDELLRGDDSSSCEVTESCIEYLTSHQVASSGKSEMQNDAAGARTSFLPGSLSINDGASTSQLGNIASRRKTFKTPSSSDVNVSSASDTSVCSVSSVVVSSANDLSHPSYSGDIDNLAVSEMNIPSASEDAAEPQNASNWPTSNAVSNSSDRNPADSSGDSGNLSSENRNAEQVSEGSDNSKLPSSTSN